MLEPLYNKVAVLKASIFIKKETTTQLFSYELCEIFKNSFQKQPSRAVLRIRCSENIQEIYLRKPMPKCNFSKVAKQLYWNRTATWAFSCKSTAYFQNTFSQEHLWRAASELFYRTPLVAAYLMTKMEIWAKRR